MNSIPETLYDAYQLYCEYLKLTQIFSKQDITAGIRTALIRYLLSKWGFPLATRKKLTQEEVNAGLDFMKQVPISELKNAIEYQNEVFVSLSISGSASARNYRMHLKKMISWCSSQSWWKIAAKTDAGKYCPAIRQKRGRVSDNLRVTEKQLTPSSLVYRLTGKAFTPHMVRDSIVTHFKLSGASDQVLAALAELMAHSLEMQRKIYDRRTPQQKVAPALEALQSLPTGTLPPPPPLTVKPPK